MHFTFKTKKDGKRGSDGYDHICRSNTAAAGFEIAFGSHPVFFTSSHLGQQCECERRPLCPLIRSRLLHYKHNLKDHCVGFGGI